MKPISLYIHIPFCKQKCNYCDFISWSGMENNFDGYINCLLKEIDLWQDRMKNRFIKTLFIGGGTPTYLHEAHICKVLDTCFRIFHIDKDAEITIESNPGSLSATKLKSYQKSGINRISMGLQACQSHHLHSLGRIHSFEEFLYGYELARDIGFSNINIDVMFGLPNQTLMEWAETLTRITALYPEHISCYSLKIEEGTPFFNMIQKNLLKMPDEDIEREMYRYAVSFLSSKGYQHYEISNFALPGYESRHNVNYWTNKEYLGMGCGAHSYLKPFRMMNTSIFSDYIAKLKNGNTPIVEQHEITRKEEAFETIMLGLRLCKGIDDKDFMDRYGFSLLLRYHDEINMLVQQDLLMIKYDNIRLTLKGLDLQNQVLLNFMEDC